MRYKIELARKILYNAADMNVSQEMLLKISQKLDQYIVEYLRESELQKGDLDERKEESGFL
ncbi:MAG: Spo0E family sporulation regulatory protein-aspartic acid phosphatase [Clostridia bacterium]|jgi:hypothetical protein|nr:Spo0E family sporulation regulatory protein-aspartic acid phosphatase [Clostridia bacterium]MDD4146622.1 Spo0E family sporulation regulatory protein-aspartic acid phosphatase [Clostridia bacterium]MDD4665424.1 Spo0E family sporulation regulatory protein-aspartic acid phosphatase [Clostridia bacterium]